MQKHHADTLGWPLNDRGLNVLPKWPRTERPTSMAEDWAHEVVYVDSPPKVLYVDFLKTKKIWYESNPTTCPPGCPCRLVLDSLALCYGTTVLLCATEYYSVPHSTALYSLTLLCTTQPYFVLRSSTLYCTVLHIPTLYYIVLLCTSQYFVLHIPSLYYTTRLCTTQYYFVQCSQPLYCAIWLCTIQYLRTRSSLFKKP